MPTVVLIKDGKTEHSIRGFDEMGGVDDFATSDFEYVLSHHGMISYDGPDRSEDISDRSMKSMGYNAMRMTVRKGDHDDLYDDDDD